MNTNYNFSLADRFEGLKRSLDYPTSRYTPYVIADCLNEELVEYIDKLKKDLKVRLIVAPAFASPKDLYLFLKENSKAVILFEDELLSRRIEYIRVLEGAVCSSPDSANPWMVNYEGEESFTFRGTVIMTSRLSKEELNSREQLMYILRDSKII